MGSNGGVGVEGLAQNYLKILLKTSEIIKTVEGMAWFDSSSGGSLLSITCFDT